MGVQVKSSQNSPCLKSCSVTVKKNLQQIPDRQRQSYLAAIQQLTEDDFTS